MTNVHNLDSYNVNINLQVKLIQQFIKSEVINEKHTL